MEVAFIGSFLIAGGAYLRWKPTRELVWYRLSAWAAANGDAAVERRRKHELYLAEAQRLAEGKAK